MRRIAGVLSLVALAVAAAPAAAAPPGNGLVVEGGFECAGLGPTTITHSAGNSAYIGSQHYVVASFSFTPTGGTTGTKTAGTKAGLSGAISCSRAVAEGTFGVVLVPVPPGS